MKVNKVSCEICRVKSGRIGDQKRNFMARFPLDEDRCKQWVAATGNEDLIYVPIEKLHQLKYVCGKHFRAKDFQKKKTQLRKNAIPCIDIAAKPLTDDMLQSFPLHIARNDTHLDHEYCRHIDRQKPSTSRTETINESYLTKKTSLAILHSFPNPASDAERFHKWVTNVGLTGKDYTSIFKNRKICHLHFDKMYHYPRNRLSRLAVPRLHRKESATEEHEVTLESPTEEPEVTLEPPIEEGPFSWQKVTEGIYTLDEEDPADADVTFCSKVQLVPDVGEPASPTRSELSCDVCQACITGFRYACVQCADCDLCDACETRGEHAAHYVLRIPRDKTHSEAQAVLAALRRTLADHSALPQLTEVKEEVKNEDPLAEVEASTEVYMQASTEVYMQADVDGSENMQMEEEYLELDSLDEDTDTDSVTCVAPTAPEKRKMPEDADVQTFSPNKRKYIRQCIRHRTQNTSVLKKTNIEKGSSFVDEDTISSVQASNEDRLEHATKSSHEHKEETSDTQFLLELFGAGSSREVFVNLKKLGEDEIVTAMRPARDKR